jgi:hypothetical protein
MKETGYWCNFVEMEKVLALAQRIILIMRRPPPFFKT